MYGLYKDPNGEQVFDQSFEFSAETRMTSALANSDPENLRMRIKELEALVAKQQVGRLT